MKTESTCMLLVLLSTGALCGSSNMPTDAVQPSIAVTEATSGPAIAHPLGTPGAAIALEESFTDPTPGSSRSDRRLAERLSGYLLLHNTWNESLSTPLTVGLNVCAE